ncbi:immunoglobulin-like domain-containing protein [Aquibacillus kalidii]|uniref:immunoglobulin-like domain-containing protein n=1 Tax=Aquibacillus kalidii TaxID=2762597 RepID=UPI001C9A275F|nr:immunoglobulin-like domain-containing protein [Aquibacillus kalidii]
MKKGKVLSLVTTATLLFSIVPSYGITNVLAASTDAEKILDYEMVNISEGNVPNSVGEFDGTLVNPDKAELISNSSTGESVVSFAGGDVDSYIEIPEGVLDNLESVTVSTLVNWEGSGGAQWLYGLGQDQTHYTYYTPSYIGGANDRVGIATNSYNNERFAASTKLPSTEWKLVTTVVNGSTETLQTYIDGELVAEASTNGYTLAEINNEDGISGYIAKSFYAADPYFGGMIGDFEIYAGALTAEEISGLQDDAEAKINAIGGLDGYFVEFAINQIDIEDYLRLNTSVNEITTDLELPDSGAYETTITWESNHPDIIASNGEVTRPSYDNGDQTVVLTATISDGTNSKTKDFTVTVLKAKQDSLAFQEDVDNLVVHHVDDVRGNLYLPTEGENGSTITWESSDVSVITTTGEVSRPAYGEGDVTVDLTATITLGDQTTTKEFSAKVKELPESVDDKSAYLMTYFEGEFTPDGEQIRFALSEGNDVTNWESMNNADPVITSHLGEKGLRDPSIIRSPEGDKFYLLATDLKVYDGQSNNNWGRTVREGSNSLMVWESTDLVNWSEQRMVEVSQPEAGMTWAPEVYYDDSTGEYIVYWSSFVYDSVADRYGNGSTHNRIMYAKTRDFYNFTEPQTLLDLGHDILDTVAIDYKDKVYRITKGTYYSEKEWGGEEIREHVFQDVGDSFFGEFELVKEGIGMGVLDHGEGAEIFQSNTDPDKFYLLIDEYGGGSGYNLFETTDLASADWKLVEDFTLPNRPRHGDVLSLTQGEYERLKINIPGVGVQVKEPVSVTGITVDKSALELEIDQAVQLTANLAPVDASVQDVVWSSSDEEVATVDQNGLVTGLKDGTATITVTTVSGGYTAKSDVTVGSAPGEGGETPPGDGSEDPGNGEMPPGDGSEDPGNGETPPGDGNEDPGNGETPPVDGSDYEADNGGTPNDNVADQQDPDDKKDELPDTATNLFNYLLAGAVLLIIGASTFVIVRKRKNSI